MTDDLDPSRDDACVNCGRTRPDGGLRLNENYEWLCRDVVGCIQAATGGLRLR